MRSLTVHSTTDSEILIAKDHIQDPASLALFPDELLAEIFSYGSAGPDGYSETNIIKPDIERAYAPIVRSSVCKRWREAALATSRLWHYVFIPRLSHSSGSWNNIVQHSIELVLERSRSVPIDIGFEFVDAVVDNSSPSTVYGPIIESLRAHQSRWRRFVVRLCGRPAIMALLHCLQGPTPMLRTLQLAQQRFPEDWSLAIGYHDFLETDADGQSTTTDVPCDILSNAPELVWLTVGNIPDLLRRVAVTPEAGHVSLEYIAPSPDQSFWDHLRRNPQIERLMFGVADHTRLTQRIEPIAQPNLYRLWLTEGAFQLFADQPDLLDLPVIATLVLVYGKFVGLELWLPRLASSLTFLDLQSVGELDEMHVDALSSLVNLDSLRVMSGTVPDAWLQQLCYVPDDEAEPVMWPLLISLVLWKVKIEYVAEGRLVDLARMRGGVRTGELDTGSSQASPRTRRWEVLTMFLSEMDSVPDTQLEEITALCQRVVE